MDLATIRASLDQTYQANRTLIAGLHEADMQRPTANPKWRVRQLAAHIAEDDGGALYVAKRLARGKNATAPDFIINLANWWSLRKYKRARSADLLRVMDTKHRELMAWLDTLTPDALQRGGEISQIGRRTLSQFLVDNRAHSQEHGNDIRAAVGPAPT